MRASFSQLLIEGKEFDMDTADIEKKVIQFIAGKVENRDASTISSASTFEELGLDSMDTIQLLFDAEDAFGISFDGEEAKGFLCVGDIVSYIEKRQESEILLKDGGTD
jgi:acyl carrier protein